MSALVPLCRTAARRSLLRVWVVVAAMLATLVLVPGSASQAAAPRIDLPVEKFVLPNGLEVLLSRDPHLATVSTDLWYHVGSANETAGRTGFAHLFEHMMFQGSGHVPEGRLDALVEGAGGYLNASTSEDYTNYLMGDLPADFLETALWLESDRMGFLLDRLDQQSLANQQAVVRNERRQNWEQAPYALSYQEVYRRLFPPDHPYHSAIIGSHADIQAAKLADIREFFKTYYVPNNATLAIVGNFDVARTKAWVTKYFGTIKGAAEPPEPAITIPTITAEKRVVLTDEVDLPKVTMAWLTPPAFAPGDATAGVTAGILAGGTSSRLYRTLVRDRKIAQEVSAYQDSAKYPSVFFIEAVAKPGHTAKELEKAIDAELAAQRASGPSPADLAAAKITWTSDLVRKLESTLGRAERLNLYNHYLGVPDYFDKHTAAYDAVSRADVKSFVASALRPDGRVVVETVPGKRVLPPDPPAPPAPPAGPKPPASAEPWRLKTPAKGAAPTVAPASVQRFVLGNGLPVYLVESHALPVVTASVVSRYGSAADPVGRAGTAGFMASMLTEGTRTRSADQIAREAAGFGGILTASAKRDGSKVTIRSLSSQAGRALALTSDLVRHPTFPKAEITRVRDDLEVALRQQGDDPASTAWDLFMPTVYGPAHPYGHLPAGNRHGLAKVTRADLIRFHSRAFTPTSSALVLAGDLTRRRAKALATKAFGSWRGSSPAPPVPGPTSGAAERVVIVDMPGSGQTALEIGQAALARSNPDFERLEVANRVLGALGLSSRLNLNLREAHGYSYGINSYLEAARGPSAFDTYGSVQTRYTGASVREIFKELRRIRTEKLSADELRRGKESFVLSIPALFQTTPAAVGTVADLYLFGLPTDYYRGLAKRIAPVTAGEVRAIAAKYIDPRTMKIVAVGDRAKIAPQLARLKLGKTVQRKADGTLVKHRRG